MRDVLEGDILSMQSESHKNTQANIICNCDMCLSMIYPTFLAGIVSGKGIKEYNSWADYAILSQ